MTDTAAATPDRTVLTYSALNTFRNCPRKYQLRYIEHLRRPDRPDSLAFGSVIHHALERWYATSADDPHRLLTVLDEIDAQYPLRDADPQERHRWHLARAMFEGYAARYPTEPFEVVEVEKEFTAEIRNPETGRTSQTFVIAGKVDGIVKLEGELYLLEHKTAASITGDYLDRLWTDTQIALYCHYLRELGYPIVGVIYNVLLKTRLRQRQGETQAEYEARRAALAAKNKSGRSTAKRQAPETDAEFRARLADWYSSQAAFHRERIYLSEDRLLAVRRQPRPGARRRRVWIFRIWWRLFATAVRPVLEAEVACVAQAIARLLFHPAVLSRNATGGHVPLGDIRQIERRRGLLNLPTAQRDQPLTEVPLLESDPHHLDHQNSNVVDFHDRAILPKRDRHVASAQVVDRDVIHRSVADE